MAIKVQREVMTLKAVFIRYLISLMSMFFMVFMVVLLFLTIGMKSGFIYPANYVENIIRQVRPVLESSLEIDESIIPFGCKFVILDRKFHLQKTNMEEEEIDEALSFAKGVSQQGSGAKQFYFIEGNDGYCVLQYYIEISYSSQWLNDNFPKPKFFIFIIVALGCIGSIILVTFRFARKLKNNLMPVMKATEKIKVQDLEFHVESSKIKEFQDILMSLTDMKKELKVSLENQWNLEQLKKEQISALAHDIKTPLTIVKGNSELLKETNLNEEQETYTDFILKNSNQIEQYIMLLTKISETKSELPMNLTKVKAEEYIEEIIGEVKALTQVKDIELQCVKENLPKEFLIDKQLFLRCIMNIISNAVDYTPKGGKIEFKIEGKEKNIRFIVIDNGVGFSSEALKSATKQFYMEDTSRNSKTHFGIGLYIAESIAKSHNGNITLENNFRGGAQVTVEIPN